MSSIFSVTSVQCPILLFFFLPILLRLIIFSYPSYSHTFSFSSSSFFPFIHFFTSPRLGLRSSHVFVYPTVLFPSGKEIVVYLNLIFTSSRSTLDLGPFLLRMREGRERGEEEVSKISVKEDARVFSPSCFSTGEELG